MLESSDPMSEQESAEKSKKVTQSFFLPEKGWRDLEQGTPAGASPDKRQRSEGEGSSTALSDLKSYLLSSLQMQHLVVLAGSGTSLGPAGGPAMWDLWDYSVNSNPGTGKDERCPSDEAQAVCEKIGYKLNSDESQNIEALLSRCEAYLQVKYDQEVTDFINKSKKVILDKCGGFINQAAEQKLDAHRTFLHRLSRRRVRDSRLKLFTTNYDLCFETAAGQQSLVVLDGFSFTQPRRFDPRFFLYDIVRRPTNGDGSGTPLEGVFHLYKLHGSVNWSRNPQHEHEIEVKADPGPDSACLIYPAKGKYQQSYIQPHLELVSQYFSALREPNTCLIVVGFGFNDDHLSEPILAAVRTNPHLRVIIVDPSASEKTGKPKDNASEKTDKPKDNNYWGRLFTLAQQGGDVCLINAEFGQFATLIPDLKSLTPAERLTRDIKEVAKS